jgi:hypothetical protein
MKTKLACSSSVNSITSLDNFLTLLEGGMIDVFAVLYVTLGLRFQIIALSKHFNH